MNFSKTEALKETAVIIAAAVNAVRAAAGDEMLQRSVLREKLFDEEMVNPSERKQMLHLVNQELGSKFSMNQIKVAPLNSIAQAAPTVVTEVTGSVEVPGVWGSNSQYMDTTPKKEPAPEPVTAPVVAPVVAASEPEPVTPAPTVKPAATSSTTPVKETTMKNTNVTDLIAINFAAIEDRKSLLDAFILANDNFAYLGRQFDKADVAIESLSAEDFAILKAWAVEFNKIESEKGAQEFIDASTRDGGFDSAWIGVGAAVVGGGLSMLAKGEVTLGGILGTAAGAGGAYFLSNQFDDKFEGDFGRYLVAGSIGLALGGVGSHLGGALIDSVMPVTLLGGKKEISIVEQPSSGGFLRASPGLQVESTIPGM